MSIQKTLPDIIDEHKPLRSTQLKELTALTDDERGELARAWPSAPVERRRQIVEQLATLAEDNVELDFDAVFLEAFDDDDATVRIGAIRGLWEHTDRELVPRLIATLQDDPIPAVRAEAALALGRWVLMGEFEQARPRDVEVVTDALRRTAADSTEPPEVRARAVEAAGASSQPWARDLIHDAYDSGEPELLTAAVHAMGRSADSYWTATVIYELHSDDPTLRYEAASAAALIEDEQTVPYLIALLDDPDAEVREQAIMALGEIGGEEAIDALRGQANAEDERMREAAVAALEQAEFGDDPLGLSG
jgi:HEAT repeat protein